MAKSRDLRERSFRFTVETVRFCRTLPRHDYELRRIASQLIDAAGSTGANLEEAAGGQTKRDFISKTCVALKEARESRYWLRILAATEPQLASRLEPLIAESTELVRMLVAAIRTAKANPSRGDADLP